MRTAGAPPTSTRASLENRDAGGWRERSGRLFSRFERPALAIVRRGFRGAFSDDELRDIYASAWLGTLRALEARHHQLSDEEVRSYLFTAVAHQASREIRRRRRKPTTPLEAVESAPANAVDDPEELAAAAERARVARDLLVSLPPRRRAVMLLRYGWGLEPKEICTLVKGLSPRAYRKEVTRGVDELTEKVRSFERGEWCTDREAILKAYVAGVADVDGERQAQAHLAHCRECSDFVARLNGHLHDLGAAAAAPAALDGLDGRLSLGDRMVELADRTRDAAAEWVGRTQGAAEEATTNVASAGGARGAGAAGAGVFAKLAGLGGAGKLAATCVGGGLAATACLATGLAPYPLADDRDREPPRSEEARADPSRRERKPAYASVAEILPSQVGNTAEVVPPPAGEVAPGQPPPPEPAPATPGPAEAQPPAPVIAPSAPAVQQEFGVAAATAPTQTGTSPGVSTAAGESSASGSQPAVQQEFGP